MSITIEGVRVEVVARRKARIEEIDAEILRLTEERRILLDIVREIDGHVLVDEIAPIEPTAEAEESGDDLPVNDPPAEANPPKCTAHWPPKRLRSFIADVLDGAPGATLERIHAGVNAKSKTGCPLNRIKAALLAGVAEGEFERREGRAGEVFCLAQAQA